MNHQKTLQKAFEAAIANGWKPEPYHQWINFSDQDKHDLYIMLANPSASAWMLVVYDKQFAKCLWGDKPTTRFIDHNGLVEKLKVYQLHLMSMIIADDPLQYLADNLPESE